ncbi:MAG: HAMP domain-containing protein [Chloroflexi bacterium]|nr:HAMP domain-containing protein [Chloroflexota bacterium]
MGRRRARFAGPVRLRTQLLASFALVAAVAVVAAGVAVVWLMLGYRTQATTNRLRDAGASAGAAGFALERQGAAPDAIASGVAAQVPLPAARVLVLDAAGVIVADQPVSDDGESQPGTFVGQRLDVSAADAAPFAGPSFFGGPEVRHSRASSADRVVVWRGNAAVPGAGGYLFVAASPPPLPPPPPDGSTRAYGSAPPGFPPLTQAAHRIVLAIPLQSLPTAWQELAPGLAAAIALLAAAVVAWWLAGSIARPIRAVTEATERVACSEPHRPIPEEGVEEVSQLARGFNNMVREVERSQEALRNFVANASHELRTPLTAIQGFSQAVADGVLEAPEPTRDAAALIHREAERMRRLVEDLLLLSRMESRGRADVRGTVDVAELIDTLAQRIELATRHRDVHLVLELPNRLLALGDASQLEHLFWNLLDNAAKYSPDGATITVRAALIPGGAARPAGATGAAAGAGGVQGRTTAASGPRVGVRVHNTGSYIPPEDLPLVFDRFYRLDKSRSRDVEGSGLGLAIAREVVEHHGGTIRAESDPATGTTFVVTLPAVPTGTAEAAPPAANRLAP